MCNQSRLRLLKLLNNFYEYVPDAIEEQESTNTAATYELQVPKQQKEHIIFILFIVCNVEALPALHICTLSRWIIPLSKRTKRLPLPNPPLELFRREKISCFYNGPYITHISLSNRPKQRSDLCIMCAEIIYSSLKRTENEELLFNKFI